MAVMRSSSLGFRRTSNFTSSALIVLLLVDNNSLKEEDRARKPNVHYHKLKELEF